MLFDILLYRMLVHISLRYIAFWISESHIVSCISISISFYHRAFYRKYPTLMTHQWTCRKRLSGGGDVLRSLRSLRRGISQKLVHDAPLTNPVTGTNEQWKRGPWLWTGYIGDEILPNYCSPRVALYRNYIGILPAYVGMKVSHCKDPDWTTQYNGK